MCLILIEGLGAIEGSASSLELEVAKKRNRRVLGERKHDEQWVGARIGMLRVEFRSFQFEQHT